MADQILKLFSGTSVQEINAEIKAFQKANPHMRITDHRQPVVNQRTGQVIISVLFEKQIR